MIIITGISDGSFSVFYSVIMWGVATHFIRSK